MKRALVCLLAACGGGDDVAPDAAPPPFQQGTRVRVEITSHGQPVADVQVIFQNADGSVLSVGVTDGVGGLGADIDDGGFVTIVEPTQAPSGKQVLTTFADVRQNDVLHLDFDPLGPLDITTVKLEFTADATAGVSEHRLRSNCGDIGAEPGVTITAELLGCAADNKGDFLLTSHDDLGDIVHSIFLADQPLDAVIDFKPATFVDPTLELLEFMPTPQGADAIAQVGVYRALATGRGTVFESGTSAVFDGSKFEGSIEMPSVPGATMITSVTAFVPTGISLFNVYDWQVGTGAYSLDLSTALLPRYTPDAKAAYDVASGTLSWGETSASVEPDLVRARLAVFRDAIPTGRGWEWRMIAPRNGTALAFPKLPVDLSGFDFNPSDGDSVGVSELTTVKFSAGVDLGEVRQHGFTSLNAFRAGAAGRIVTQDLYAPEL